MLHSAQAEGTSRIAYRGPAVGRIYAEKAHAMDLETLPESLDVVSDDAATIAPKRRGSARAAALAVFVGMVLILGLVVGWLPTTGLASAWNQLTHPPFSAGERQQLSALVTSATTGYTQESSVMVGSLRSVRVMVTVAWTTDITAVDVAKEQARVKAICFQVQKAMWSSKLSPSDVLVLVMGPVADAYAQLRVDAHGSAELSQKIASALTWGTLNPDSAWARYDHAYLRPSYIWYVL